MAWGEDRFENYVVTVATAEPPKLLRTSMRLGLVIRPLEPGYFPPP
jgi:hypothetical protein